MNPLIDAKKDFRRRAMQTRDAAAPDAMAASQGVMRLFMDTLCPAAPSVISGFSPIGSEIDTIPLLSALIRHGHEVALPVVTGRGEPLLFRKWSSGDEMSVGPFGVQEPLATSPERVPEVLLVPLLAFDRRGYRLGYGGGFYDRTLARLRKNAKPVAVGVAFAVQEVDAVPVAEYDQPLNWIVTEREAIEIGA